MTQYQMWFRPAKGQWWKSQFTYDFATAARMAQWAEECDYAALACEVAQ